METINPPGYSPGKPTGSHSLGKLIEWKRKVAQAGVVRNSSSHSLGKLIEWKRGKDTLGINFHPQVPTRWGN